MLPYRNENGVLTFQEGLEIVQPELFIENMDIQKVVLPSSVREIGGGAFAGCENLAEVVCSGENGVEQIGDGAFTLCHHLEHFPFGKKLKTIGEMAFWETALTHVCLPEMVASVGDNAFWSCGRLREFTVKNPRCVIGMDVVGDCPSLTEGFVAPGYPVTPFFNQADELNYTLLYFSHQEGHTKETKERAENFAKDEEMVLMERIIRSNNTSAMTGLIEAKMLNEDHVDKYLEQASKENLTEIMNLLLEVKRNTTKTIDFGALEL